MELDIFLELLQCPQPRFRYVSHTLAGNSCLQASNISKASTSDHILFFLSALVRTAK